MTEEQKQQIRDIMGTAPFILIYDTTELGDEKEGSTLDYIIPKHASTFTLVGMMKCTLEWFVRCKRSA